MTRAFEIALAAGLAAASVAASSEAGTFTLRTESGIDWDVAAPDSLDAALGFAERQTFSVQGRLMWQESAGALRFEAHLLMGAAQGDEVLYRSAIEPFLPPAPPATLFNLTAGIRDGDALAAASIDRLSLSWSSDNLVLKVGRQAITWGEGLVFHPGDIVAPFAPNATDTSYKPGADMLYAQYLFASGADIQAIWVPRAQIAGGPVDVDASTFALRGAFQAGAVDISLMGARDRGDWVAGLGLAGSLGQGSWKAEYVGWQMAGGSYAPSWLLSYSNISTLGDMSVTWFGEYFHNGFGAAPGATLDALPANLVKRLGTGQVFVTGREYLALGASAQISPALSFSPLALLSLEDGSALLSLSADWALDDNTNLTASWSQPLGDTGTSLGGLETSPGSGVYASPPRAASLKLVRFF